MILRRLALAGVVMGGLIAGGAVAALAHVGNTPTAAPALANQNGATSLTTLPSSQSSAAQPNNRGGGRHGGGWGEGGRGFGGPGFGGPGFGRGRGFLGRGGLTVTGVNGNTITATTERGVTVTVTVSATTVYTEAGASAALSDVHVGSNIAVQGTRAAAATPSGQATIQASAVLILLPREAGVVSAVNGSTLTITGFNGASRSVVVDSATRYQRAGQSAALSDVTVGTAIVAEGTLQSDNSLHAVRIVVQLPRIAGPVTAVNGTSYTVSGRRGQSYTVNTTGSTTYVNPDGTTAAASAIKANSTYILAEGTLSADGKTLTALRITVLTARGPFGHGFGHHRGGGPGNFGNPGSGFGFGFGNPGGTPGTTAPSTTGTGSV